MTEAIDPDALDEKGGYFYEALLSFAISATCSHIPAFELHKRLLPNAMVSDVIIPSAAHPRAVILCTHSHATSGTNMKSWRNIDEMLFIRSNFADCAIINLIFPSEWKPELLRIMGEICDCQIMFPPNLTSAVLQLAHDALHQKIRSTEEYIAWLQEYDRTVMNPVLSFLGKELDRFFANGAAIDRRWARFAAASPRHGHCLNRYRADCHFKKGMNKLCLTDEETRELLYRHRNQSRAYPHSTLDQLVRVGIFSPRSAAAIAAEYVLDPDVDFVLRLSKPFLSSVFSLVDRLHGDDCRKLTAMVSGSGGLHFHSFTDQLQKAAASGELKQFLMESLSNWPDTHPGERNLPLDYLYVIAKKINPRFSHKVLSDHCGLPMIGGVSPIPEFLYGKRELSRRHIASIADYFAAFLSSRDFPDTGELWDRLLHETADKLIKHKYVNFLLYAVIRKCMDCGLTVSNLTNPSVAIGNGIADYCINILGSGISGTTAQTKFSFSVTYGGSDFVFLVISANSATHKHKEYPARWRCASVSFVEDGFLPVNRNKKWIVVMDGLWSTLFADFQDVIAKFEVAGANAVYDIKSFLELPDLRSDLQAILAQEDGAFCSAMT